MNAITVWLRSEPEEEEEEKNHGSQIPPHAETSALTLRFVHKGLYGANCRALDDITAIFELHNAHCRIMKGTTHFKKLISFPFVLQSDDTNPPTMAECFAARRTESKSDRFVKRQPFFRGRKGPRGRTLGVFFVFFFSGHCRNGHFPQITRVREPALKNEREAKGADFRHSYTQEQRQGGRFVFCS